MGGAITIYFNENNYTQIKDIKNKNPDFNLSQFITSKLNEFVNEHKNNATLISDLAMKKLEILKINNEILLIEKEITKNDEQEKLKKEEDIKNSIFKEKKKKEYLKCHKEQFLYFFDISEESAEISSEDMYENAIKKSVIEYGVESGYLFKEKEVPALLEEKK